MGGVEMSGGELESALLLLVPVAEAAVGAQRARLDSSARDGVPAHVTVLYPFLPPAEIGPGPVAGSGIVPAAVGEENLPGQARIRTATTNTRSQP